jgi:hypothetical protein
MTPAMGGFRKHVQQQDGRAAGFAWTGVNPKARDRGR